MLIKHAIKQLTLSTFKIITLTASIEEQTVNLFEDQYTDTGGITVEGSRIKCWKSGGHGTQTFLQVVENSCNPGFVVMGQRLGTSTLFTAISFKIDFVKSALLLSVISAFFNFDVSCK